MTYRVSLGISLVYNLADEITKILEVRPRFARYSKIFQNIYRLLPDYNTLKGTCLGLKSLKNR